MKPLLKSTFLGVALLATFASPLPATEFADVAQTRYKFAGLFHVFDATFRTQSVFAQEDPLGNFPKELEFEYARRISSEQLIEAAEKILVRNTPEATLAAIAPQINEINDAYQDVNRGDRYTLRYEPGVGTSLLRNDEFVWQTPGEKFQRVYFSIWLGPDSPFDLKPR